MIYTSLDFKGKRAFKGFPLLDKIKIHNGVTFFKIFRVIMKCLKRVKHAGAAPSLAEIVATARATGSFETIVLYISRESSLPVPSISHG